MAVHDRVRRPDPVRDNRVITKCTKGEGKPAVATRMSGADLSAAATGKAHLKASLAAVLGENPPYGMIGGIEETSASFEARSAPRSYPTIFRPLRLRWALLLAEDADT